MCLGVPGRVERIWSVHGTPMGMVDFGGVRKEVCLAYVPEVAVDEYVIVHVGFAITRLDEASALETLDLFRSIGALEEEFADPLAADPLAADPLAADPVTPGILAADPTAAASATAHPAGVDPTQARTPGGRDVAASQQPTVGSTPPQPPAGGPR